MAASQSNAQLERSIGLVGATALVVGAVIGAGLYTILAEIAQATGNTLWLAFMLAMLVSLVSVIPLIEIAGAIPRAGAGYLFTSRLLAPWLGFLTSYWILLGGASSTCLVALTMAEYVAPLLPAQTPHLLVAVLILGLFYAVYQFGVQLAAGLQVAMAAQFVIALLIFAGAGLWQAPHYAMGLAPPQGWGAFFGGAILCYTTCMGFQVVAELGEEIKAPRRNIPLALLIGGAIVAVIYIGVGTAFVSNLAVPLDAVREMRQPLTTTAAAFLPAPLVLFLALGAYGAGLTSLNAAAIALPRELYAQARDGLIPAWLGAVSPRTHTPQHAVTAYFLFCIALLLLAGQGPGFFGVMTAVGILAMSAILCIAALRLETRFPAERAAAFLTFPRPLLWCCTVITVAASLGLIVIVLLELPRVALIYAAWTGIVLLLYRLRTRRFTPEDWARIAAIPRGNAAE
jgi:amino acid transporter